MKSYNVRDLCAELERAGVIIDHRTFMMMHRAGVGPSYVSTPRGPRFDWLTVLSWIEQREARRIEQDLARDPGPRQMTAIDA